MVRMKRILIGLLFLAIAIVAAVRVLPSEEKRVRKQFKLLSKWVSKNSGESPITSAARLQKLRSLFAQNCRLETHISWFSGDYTGEELASLIARTRLLFSSLSLRLYDLNVGFTHEDSATVRLTTRVKGRTTDGEFVDESHEVECLLEKTDGKWLFREAKVVEVLER